MAPPDSPLKPDLEMRDKNLEIRDQNLRGIYTVKALALLLILGSYWIMELFVSPFGNGLTITLTVFAVLLPTVLVLRGSDRDRIGMLRLSLFIDVLALTTAVHLSGGVDNVSLPMLYPAIISLAGILLTRADTFVFAFLSVLTYAAMVYAEYAGLLPHLVPYSRPPARQVATVVPMTIFLFVYAWLVSFATEKMRSLYRRTEELRREAVHALSHDLKNPLSVIHGYAQMLPSVSPAERDTFAHGIERTAQQALDLVSNVLDAAVLEGRPLTPRLHPVQVNELVLDVTERYRLAAEAAKVNLATEMASDLPLAQIDGQLVARAIGNLISNAIKYSVELGDVRVATTTRNEHVCIHVSDTGPGIGSDELPLLFQRYSRTSSARGVEGSGLGLYLVRCIAEAHRGEVKVDSLPGRGSTFTLSLPVLGPST